MELELFNNIFKKNNSIKEFIKKLQSYLDKSNEREEVPLINSELDENVFITKYRDRFNVERNNILNEYAKKTLEKGQMYYVYSKNSNTENGYNLCICEEDKSHIIIEENKSSLPENTQIGSVLRKKDDKYVLDIEDTQNIANEIYRMKEMLQEEQNEFLKSQRIEGHIYEIFEKENDRAFLFDNSSNEEIQEEFEETDFPKDLLNEANEGDLFIYEDGEYRKY